jgi:hypothetical protein
MNDSEKLHSTSLKGKDARNEYPPIIDDTDESKHAMYVAIMRMKTISRRAHG